VVGADGAAADPAAGVATTAPASNSASTAPAARALAGEPFVRTLLWVSALTGLSSFVYEIAWIRMLSMVLSSATHSFEIMLASFILGLALGGWWIRKRIERIGAGTLVYLAVVQMMMGVLALATVPLYNYTFDAMAWLMSGLARSEQGFVLYTLALTAVALAVMLPATFCAGMTLPLITSHLYRHGSGERAIGQTYAANTLGAIAGVLLTVHLLMPGLGLKNTMAVGAAIDIALGLVLLARRYRPQAALRPGLRGLAVTSLAAACLIPALVRFDPLRMGSTVYRDGARSLDRQTAILFAKDGKTATVQVARFPDGVLSISTNGKSDGGLQTLPGRGATRDEATMVMTGALPLVYRPRAEQVAVIGFGTGLSSATLLGSPHLKRLDTIEIEPAIVEGARLMRPANEAAYTDRRHHIVIDDAKAFFSRGQRRYDAIVSEPSNPWISGVASLFTEEFYSRVKTHLKPDGLLVQWIHIYEISPELVASIFNALARSFPNYDVYMSSPGDMIIVAGGEGRPLERSAQAFEMPAVKALLERVGVGGAQELALQFVSNQRALAPLWISYAVPANSDYFPIVDVEGLKARYTRQDAMALTVLHAMEVPALRALDGVAPFGAPAAPASASRGPTAVSPREGPYLHAALLAAFVGEGRLPPPQATYAPDMTLAAGVRNRLFGCGAAGAAQVPWDSVVRFAADVLPYLDAAKSKELWRSIRESPCARAFSADEVRWVEMFERVARARWGEAGEVAIELLAAPGDRSHHARVVLTQVAATGLILKGRRLDALRVLGAQVERLPAAERRQAWVRLLWYQALAPALEAPGAQ
jgi:predicted membrane-bound spermidine synthase